MQVGFLLVWPLLCFLEIEVGERREALMGVVEAGEECGGALGYCVDQGFVGVPFLGGG